MQWIPGAASDSDSNHQTVWNIGATTVRGPYPSATSRNPSNTSRSGQCHQDPHCEATSFDCSPFYFSFSFRCYYFIKSHKLYQEPLLTLGKVLEYLSKKGYKRTEATLRKESEEHDPNTGLAMSSKKPDDAEVTHKAYGNVPTCYLSH
jgi:hypothetical protein